jgi:hypothetical protein
MGDLGRRRALESVEQLRFENINHTEKLFTTCYAIEYPLNSNFMCLVCSGQPAKAMLNPLLEEAKTDSDRKDFALQEKKSAIF